MVALEGNFAYSLLLGMFAAVNPCGFVLLPTYLVYFLGIENQHTGAQRAGIERALIVSAAMSAGFLTVFVIVGTVSRVFTTTIQANAKYASLIVGLALIALGGRMMTGWKPKVSLRSTGRRNQRSRTVWSMFAFGIAYAVASIGCTIGFLVSAVLGSFGSQGFVSGVLSVTLYGAGMAMIVTALTVTLAFANGGLTRILRKGIPHLDRVAAMFVIATGIYLAWYWYQAINEHTGDAVTGNVETWQSNTVNLLQRTGIWKLTAIFGIAVVSAIVYVVIGRHRQTATRDEPLTAPPDTTQR